MGVGGTRIHIHVRIQRPIDPDKHPILIQSTVRTIRGRIEIKKDSKKGSWHLINSALARNQENMRATEPQNKIYGHSSITFKVEGWKSSSIQSDMHEMAKYHF